MLSLILLVYIVISAHTILHLRIPIKWSNIVQMQKFYFMNLGYINRKAVLEYIKILKLCRFTFWCLKKKIEVTWKTQKYKIFKISCWRITGMWIMFQVYLGLLICSHFSSFLPHCFFFRKLKHLLNFPSEFKPLLFYLYIYIFLSEVIKLHLGNYSVFYFFVELITKTLLQLQKILFFF